MMLDKISKLIPLSFLSFYATTAFAYSPQAQQAQNLESQVSAISQENVEGSVGGRNPAQPKKDRRYGVFVEGDYLYWRANQEGLHFATSSTAPATPFMTIAHGKTYNINPGYRSGFRVGGGYRFVRDDWETRFIWTSYKNTKRNSAEAPDGGFIYAVWSPTDIGNLATTAHARWEFGYHIFDAELGRNYFVSEALTLRPFVGIRGAWIDQDLHVNYGSGPEVTGSVSTESKLSNDYHAGGVRVGFNLGWFFCRMFGIYGHISSSLVYGHFDVDTDVEESDVTGGVDLSADINRLRPNLEAGLGLQWATNFNKERCRVTFSAGYEIIQWWNMNQLAKVELPGIANGLTRRFHGDLGLQGLTVAGRLDF